VLLAVVHAVTHEHIAHDQLQLLHLYITFLVQPTTPLLHLGMLDMTLKQRSGWL